MKTGVALILASCVVTLSAAAALEVAPARITIEAPGIGARGKVIVRNASEALVPIEVSVDRRQVDRDGVSSFSDANGDFIVFPPQALLRPGSGQTVQFQYVGAAFADESRAYVIRVTEIPVEETDGVGVQVIYEFGVALYIAPPDTRVQLDIEAATSLGNGQYEVFVRNSGGRHAVLGSNGLQSVIDENNLLPDSVGERVDLPIVPPNMVRRFVVGIE